MDGWRVEMMEAFMSANRYVIPALVAAAVHAALLLAFPGGQAPDPDNGDSTDKRILWQPPEQLIIVPPARSAEREKAASAGGEPVRSLPEDPAPPAKSDFTMPKPPDVPVERKIETGKIPTNPGLPGNPDLGRSWMQGDGAIGLELLDNTPRARSQIEPVYPYALRREGVEGSVEVAFVVGPDGMVRSAHAVRSTHREFEEAALRAVLKWKFEPGRSNGRPVPFRMTVPLHFRLAAD